MRQASEPRLTAEEMRKRRIKATRQHQDALDARQENARVALGATVVAAPRPRGQGGRQDVTPRIT